MTSSVPFLRQFALRVVFTACVASLAACGGGGGGGGESGNPSSPPSAVAAPTIGTQPAAVSVAEGENVTFSVAATGGGTLSYQWLLNGVEVAGATAATYRLGAATLAQSGRSYSVRVSNAGGSVTSQAASLTVTAGGPQVAVTVQRLSASPSGYILGARADGSVVAWGTGMVGGNGTALAGSAARVVTGVSGAAAVIAHPERSLVIASNGSLSGWGRNAEGALGVRVSSFNQLVPDAVPIGQVASVAQAMTCDRATYVLKTDGTVWLVPGQRDSQGTVVASRVAGLAGIQTLVVAEDSGISCDLMALDVTGRAWITAAREGDPDPTTQLRSWTATVTPYLVVPPQTQQLACSAVIVDSNLGHCLARTADGRLWSWGQNNVGQLGLGDQVGRAVATQFGASANTKKLLAGTNYSYLLTTDGAVYGWGGLGPSDQMTAGRDGIHTVTQSDFWVPGLLPLVSGVEDLVMPGRFPEYMAAMRPDGTVWVWGHNLDGVFGDGAAGTFSAAPVQVRGVVLK